LPVDQRYWHKRADERLDNHTPKCDQQSFVVKDKEERPMGFLMVHCFCTYGGSPLFGLFLKVSWHLCKRASKDVFASMMDFDS